MQLRKSNDFRRSASTLVSGFERTGRTQCVQWMVGILRLRQAFFWLRVFSCYQAESTLRRPSARGCGGHSQEKAVSGCLVSPSSEAGEPIRQAAEGMCWKTAYNHFSNGGGDAQQYVD